MPMDWATVVPSPKSKSFRKAATDRYVASLDYALPYLEGRGISAEVARRWRIGYVAEPLAGHEPYKGRIAIPYLSRGGVLAFNFRCMHEDKCGDEYHSKYMFETGGYRRLFNVYALSKGLPKIYVTEGELDAVYATEAGLPAVAIPMAGAWSAHWELALAGPSELVTIIDADKAGTELVNRLRSKLGHKITVVSLPPGHDVTSFGQEFGAHELRKLAGE